MKKILQVSIEKGEKYYVAEFIDLPIVTQALTLDELMKNIKESFSLYVEDFEQLKERNINNLFKKHVRTS